MADTKISALTALAVDPADDDVLPIVDTSAVETKKITWLVIKTALDTVFDAVYAALSHTHAATDITSASLDGDRLAAPTSTKRGGVKATGTPSGKFLKDDDTWSDASIPGHAHAGADITSGTIDGDRLPAISTTKLGGVPATGTPSGKFLKDDSTWASPSGSGDMLKATYDTDDDGSVNNAEALAGTTPTAAGLALLDDADASAQRTTLGLGGAAVLNVGTGAGDVAAGNRGVTNADTHDHSGGDGGQIDHGGLAGLADDDHTQYIKHSLATAADDFLIADVSGSFVKHTLAQTKSTLGLGDAAYKNTGTTAGTVSAGDDSRFVTGGNSHDHAGGDGAQIDHTGLSNIGTNAHSVIDIFIASKASASGLASLDGSSKVVQDPANATATPTASKIAIADGSAKLDGWISAASDTVDGLVELATATETGTGTDATRAVTPDGLAGSTYGKRVVQIKVFDDATTVTTGDSKFVFCVPTELNGYNLVDADSFCSTVSSSGTPTVQVRNVTDAQDMLSTAITIDASEYTSYTAVTPPVINASYDDVATGDLIAIDVDVAGTGTKGLGVILTFQLP